MRVTKLWNRSTFDETIQKGYLRSYHNNIIHINYALLLIKIELFAETIKPALTISTRLTFKNITINTQNANIYALQHIDMLLCGDVVVKESSCKNVFLVSQLQSKRFDYLRYLWLYDPTSEINQSTFGTLFILHNHWHSQKLLFFR